MKAFKLLLIEILKFLATNSVFLAIDGVLIATFGYFLYGIQINAEILLAACLAVFSVYSLNKVTDKVEDSINRPEMPRSTSRFNLGISISTLVVSLGIGASVSFFALLILATPIIAGFFYSVRLSASLPKLKEIVGVKSILVAFSWSMNGCLLPLSLHQVELEVIVLVFFYIFIRVLVGTILFDVLDAKGDSIAGVKTIPIRLGRKRTSNLLFITNSLLALWLTYCLFRGLFLAYMPALIFGMVYGYVLIWGNLKTDCQKLCKGLMVDWEWLLIIAFMKIIVR